MDRIINKANELSNSSMIFFLKKMNISSEIMDEIVDIPIEVKKIDEAIAKYEVGENKIIYSQDELNNITRRILENREPESVYEELIEVAQSLTHEKIHACRTINAPSNKLNTTDYIDYSLEGLEYILKKAKHPINERFVVCDIDYELDLGDLQNKIINGMEPRRVDAIMDESNHRLKQQDALEESITEALTNIISLNLYSELRSSSVDELTDLTIRKTKNNFVKAGAKIIDSMDKNMIEWFLTTKSQTEYNNLFKETFSDKYPELLDIMHKMKESSPEQMERLDSIIREKNISKENNQKKEK